MADALPGVRARDRRLDSPRRCRAVITFLVRLRPRRRVRRRLPRRHRADRARGARHRRHATASPRHDVRAGALVLRRALPYFPPGVHLAVVDPEVGGERRARRAAHAPRRTASSSAPTTGCSRWPPSASAASWRPSTSRARRTASSRRRRPSTGATSSRRWPRSWRPARRWREAGEPIDADELAPLDMPPAPRVEDGGARRPRAGLRPLRQRHARRRARRAGRLGLRARPRGRRSTTSARTTRRRSPTSPPGELLLYEDAYRTLALAVNRGSAARHARRSTSTPRSASAPA